MVIGILNIDLNIPGNNSLKGKRRVLKSLKDKIRGKFNVSVAEVGNKDLWQRANLGIAVVSDDRRQANKILSKVIELIELANDTELLNYEMELL
ncbi:DUF503 domain-containing protein [candidate division NPL-UPA2 bacterium]|nr:DUF503 domain-containing protein [candidate division NPL-UPA2 bacterium]